MPHVTRETSLFALLFLLLLLAGRNFLCMELHERRHSLDKLRPQLQKGGV